MERLSTEWLPAVLAGVSLLVSTATLIVAVLISRTARRSERAGDERLEILREQQQRLDYLDQERRALLDTLELLRREMNESERRLELPPAPPEPRDAPETADEELEGSEPPFTEVAQEGSERRSGWWCRLFGQG